MVVQTTRGSGKIFLSNFESKKLIFEFFGVHAGLVFQVGMIS